MKTIPLLAALATSLGQSSLAAAATNPADAFPSRPIRIIVAYPPAGTTDILARVIGQKMTETWGQSTIVENRPGANGNIGTDIPAQRDRGEHFLFHREPEPAVLLWNREPEKTHAPHFFEYVGRNRIRIGDFLLARNEPVADETFDRVEQDPEAFGLANHSAFTPASRITFCHFAISERMNAPNS